MIDINETIHVAATPDEVWKVISDPHEVVGCIPDGEITSENEDGSYDGRVTIRFGPMRVKFQARVALDLDEATHSGVITARGKDGQGGTRMKTTANFDLTPNEPGTETTVAMKGQVELSGRLASQIEAAAGVVVRKMSAEFSDNLARRLSGDSPDAGDGEPTRGLFRRR